MPTLAYRITEWKKRYEVTYKGRIADEGTPLHELRIGPLEFIRFKVFGHRPGPAMKRIIRLSEQYGPWAGPGIFGIFGKLLELSGNTDRKYRGWILCEKQKPLESEGIAEILGFDEKIVSIAMEILCNPKIGWIQHIEYTEPETEKQPVFREIPEHSGTFQNPLLNESENERANERLNETKEQPSRKNREEPVSLVSSKTTIASLREKSRMVRDMETIESIEKVFAERTAADDSCIRNIVRHVPSEKHELLIQFAQDSLQGRKPIAKFVDLAKRRLGFRGNGGP